MAKRSAIQNLILPATANTNPNADGTENSIVLLRRENLDEIRHRTTDRTTTRDVEKASWKACTVIKVPPISCRGSGIISNYAKRNKPGDPWSDRWKDRLQ